MRRISTKLVVAVLAAVVLPFVAFAVFLDVQIAERVTRRVAQQALIGISKDLAGQLDQFVEERRSDVELWGGAPFTSDAVEDYVLERARLRRIRSGEGEGNGAPIPWSAELLNRATVGGLEVQTAKVHWKRWQLTSELNRYIELKSVYDRLLVIADDGQLVTCSSRDPRGEPLSLEDLEALFERDYSQEDWFRGALEQKQLFPVDQHSSELGLPNAIEVAGNYHLGFAVPIETSNGPPGVLYALVNWRDIQKSVSDPVVKDALRGLVEGREPTPYAWIWSSDADTIIAHPDQSLYGKSITNDVELPQMTRAVLESDEDFGLYPAYQFRGVGKNAAFTRTADAERGGFHWVVGVGIDDKDIYSTAGALRRLLFFGTLIVLALASLWTLIIARKTTGPILELQRYTRRVARGDIDAQVQIRSRDELGELADDFNAMTRELKAQRAALVKAEKDAAWREMARQIAHDIKNPLTPINLSLDLLERARRENAPGSEEILERTMGLIRRQVAHLREISGDFYEFTGGHKPKPEVFELTELLDETLHLHDAWAVELGVNMQREGSPVMVFADPSKLRRVFVNLMSNSLQAMPDGGELLVETRVEDDRAVCLIQDSGQGLAEEARERLFEPYFTTKSEGTGLGLAISKRVMEESDGGITLEPREGGGTTATVWLPLANDLGGEGSP